MLLGEPKDHFVPNENGELLLELAAAFRFREATSNCHDGRREQSFSCQRAHKFLDVWRESEGHGLGVVEVRLVGDHRWYKLRAPYVARGARDGKLMGKAASHVHDVRHERKGSELIRELSAEEEEVRVGGIGRLEVVECDFIGDPFTLDSSKDLRTKGMILGLVGLVWRHGAKPVHSKQNGFVFVQIIAPTMVFVNPLQ